MGSLRSLGQGLLTTVPISNLRRMNCHFFIFPRERNSLLFLYWITALPLLRMDKWPKVPSSIEENRYPWLSKPNYSLISELPAYLVFINDFFGRGSDQTLMVVSNPEEESLEDIQIAWEEMEKEDQGIFPFPSSLQLFSPSTYCFDPLSCSFVYLLNNKLTKLGRKKKSWTCIISPNPFPHGKMKIRQKPENSKKMWVLPSSFLCP